MNREAAERAAARVAVRYRGADVTVTGMSGGRIDVSGDLSFTLTVADENSPLLALFGPDPEPEGMMTALLGRLRWHLRRAARRGNCHWPRCRMSNGNCDEGRNCVN